MASQFQSDRLLAHPLTIAVSGAGCVLFGVLSYRTLLDAIPPECMRASALTILPAVACIVLFAMCLVMMGSGLFHRVWPAPTWRQRVWASTAEPALSHAGMFALYAAVFASTDLPAGCTSPSWTELAVIGLCQLAHVAVLVRNAVLMTASRQTKEQSHG